MHRALWFVLLFASMAAACRQADGPMPSKDGEVPNRLEDIKRDLMSAAAGDREAIGDLGDDLTVFAERNGTDAARALAQRVGTAVSGSQLTDESATRLADRLWVAVAARQISGRQAEALQNDVRELLVSVGATQQNADAAAAQVGEAQKAVTARNRRWYERF